MSSETAEFIAWFEALGIGDVAQVGGKNASLGEMISELSKLGIRVPDGFATTASAYQAFLNKDGLDDRIHAMLDALDVSDVSALARTGAEIRALIMATPFPADRFDGRGIVICADSRQKPS